MHRTARRRAFRGHHGVFYYIAGVSAQITVPRVPLDATTGRDAYLAQTPNAGKTSTQPTAPS
ncbi:hypothetical protein AB0G77_36545 [Streptomyces hygroscopicus]|uniref:hypothetical protein n=1 Tax=Streptomyces hygroscopicus TaxID=1912 RepID=UPI0033ED3E87